MNLSPTGLALFAGLLLQLPGVLGLPGRRFCLAAGLAGAAVVFGVCVQRHDALLFAGQAALLPVLLVPRTRAHD